MPRIALLLVTFLALIPASTRAGSREIRGVSHWSEGHGDCGANQGVGGFGNGTGFAEDFHIKAVINIQDDSITNHFLNFNGHEFFNPTIGTLDNEGNFDAKSREGKYDEDYEFKGKVGSAGVEGVYTRLSHYVGEGNSGPRCTATWKVTLKDGDPGPKPGTTPHPTTVSKPPASGSYGQPPVATPKPSEPESSGGGNGLWIAGALVALGATIATILKQVKKKPKADCQCTLTATISGPTQLHVPQCAKPKKWPMQTEPEFRALLDAGDGSARHYSVDVKRACTGGGQLDIDKIHWKADWKDDHHIMVNAVVETTRRCPGEPDQIQSAIANLEVAIALTPCCGPDITDQYVAAINRIYSKLAADWPLSTTVFMARWGARMIYRPYGHGKFFEDQCPSEKCKDTVTMLGKCYDCFVGDNLLFGIVAGFLEISLLELEAGGWIAKLVKNPSIGAHLASEELWRKGHDIGGKAKENHGKQKPHQFTREMLAQALQGVPEHEGCTPCQKPGPEQAFIDFSHEPF